VVCLQGQMTHNLQNEAEETWLDYLHAVQSLSAEMNAALAAVAGNDLARLESSVAAQERLSETARSLWQSMRANPGQVPRIPLQQLAAAGEELRQNNRVYAAVLARAARVGSALLSLYQEAPRGYSRDGRVVPTTNTWSCEG